MYPYMEIIFCILHRMDLKFIICSFCLDQFSLSSYWVVSSAAWKAVLHGSVERAYDELQ